MKTQRDAIRRSAPAWAAAGLAILLAVAAGPMAHAATLLGLIDTGEIYSSANGGASWTGISTLPVRDAVGLQARLTANELYLASRSGTVYQSVNGGTSWSAVGTVPASDVEDLLVRIDGALMLLTGTGSVYRSTDQGASFTGVAALTGSNFVSLTQRTDGKIYALTRTGEVYESTDLGINWIAKSAITVANAIRIRTLGATTLYVMTETGDIAKSTDAAATWSVVGTLSQVGMRGLVKNGATLVAASREGHVATSADGVSWTWQGSINQLVLTALATNDPVTTSVEPPTGGSLALGPPHPNPSLDGAGVFPVRLEREGSVTLELCDLAGRIVARRAPEILPAGRHSVAWTPDVRRAGLYFARLRGEGGAIAERRWIVLR